MYYWYHYLGYVAGGAVILTDIILELLDETTISEYVWGSGIPGWIWYALGLIGLNIAFWLISPEVALLGLAFYLAGHFSR